MQQLDLEVGAGMGPAERYHVEFGAKKITVHYEITAPPDKADAPLAQVLTGDDVTVFMTQLAAIGLEKWQRHYQSEIDILDGPSWSLRFRDDAGHTHHADGYNNYPPSWQQLEQLLKAAVLTPTGHLKAPTQMSFSFVRFGEVTLDNYDAAATVLPRVALFQQTYAIDGEQGVLEISTTYPDSRRNQRTTYHDVPLVMRLSDDLQYALSRLGHLKTRRLDTTVAPDTAFRVVLSFPGKTKAIIIEVDGDDMPFRQFYAEMIDVVKRRLRHRRHQRDEDFQAFGPVIQYFVQVVFPDGHKPYVYQTDLLGLNVGDEVIVPVGDHGHTTAAEIIAIDPIGSVALPPFLDPDKIKSVISRVDRF